MVQTTLDKELDKATEVVKTLNTQVANLNVLYTKLHHFHWFVEGKHFFALHTKFEELYDEVTLRMDEVAERILTIGGKPLSTLKQYLNEATIKEAQGGEAEQQMVEILREDLVTLSKEFREGMNVAESNGDEATADMLLGIKSSFEKHIWMLSAFLKK